MRAWQKSFRLFWGGQDKTSSVNPKADREGLGSASAPRWDSQVAMAIPEELLAAVIEKEVAWLVDLSEQDPSLDYGTIYALLVRLHERRL